MLFEEMGFSYFGPVDGHDVVQLAKVFQHVKQMKGPVLVHCVTKKGKGYAPAEETSTPGTARASSTSHRKFLKSPVTKAPPPTYTSVFGKAVGAEANSDPRIVGITAAMPEGTGMDLFRDEFPKRYFDVRSRRGARRDVRGGSRLRRIQAHRRHLLDLLQRGYDQIEHDVCLQSFCGVLPRPRRPRRRGRTDSPRSVSITRTCA